MLQVRYPIRARTRDQLSRAVALAWAVVVPGAAFSAQSQTIGLATPPGQFAVSQDGGASYFLPLKVGPGLAGIAPELGLSYQSQSSSGDGLMGMAWNLTGLSSIERCANTMVHDGLQKPVQFLDSDKYCLDGQRLLLVSGTYGQDGAHYRTEIDSFSKIVGVGRAGNGAASFKVWPKNGTVREYGSSTDSRIEANFRPGTAPSPSASTVRVWALNKISDAKGNYLTVSYNKDTVNGVYSPARIDYAANNVANTQPQSSVVFSYIARVNSIPKYNAGTMSKRITTLSEISTYYQGTTLLSKTKLAYQNAGPTLTPRLNSVQHCDAADNCLLPLNMQYATQLNGFASTGTNWPLPLGHAQGESSFTETNGTATTVSLEDMNGDGLPDLYTTKNTYENGVMVGPRVYLNSGRGFSSPKNWPLGQGAFAQGEASVGIYAGLTTNYTTVDLVDLNGDGLPDLYVSKQTYENGVPVGPRAYLNWGGGFSAATNWPLAGIAQSESSSSSNGSQTAVGLHDFNGDGLPDLYITKNGVDANGTPVGPRVHFNSGAGFSGAATAWPLRPGVYAQHESHNGATMVSLVDLNGDGLADLYLTKSGVDENGTTLRPSVYFNTGNGFSTVSTSWPLQAGAFAQGESYSGNTTTSLVDLNGDGLPDLYVTRSGANENGTAYTPVVYFNTGNGFSGIATPWTLPGVVAQGQTLTQTSDEVSNSTTTVSLRDFDGDGMPDLYVSTAGVNESGIPVSPKVFFNQSRPLHLLTQVGSSIGANTTISYGTLANSALYTKDSGASAAAFPKIDMLSAAPVVATVAYDNGIGSANTIAYTYGGLKKDVGPRRGTLGFRWIKSRNVATGVEQYSEYRQDFPYIGMLARSEMRLAAAGNSGVLKRTTNTAACHIASTGAACTPATGVIYHPYLASVVEENWDLNGVSMPGFTHTTQYTSFPHYGDPSQTSTVSSDGIGKTTTLTYWPADLNNWIVGRLKSSAVTSSNP